MLRVRRHRGHTHRVNRLSLPMTSLAGRAFQEQRAFYVGDAETNPMVTRTTAGRPVKTLLCLPFYSFQSGDAGRPVGVFSVASNYAEAFTLSDQAFISACADIIALVEFFRNVFEEAIVEASPEAASGGPAQAPAELPAAGHDGTSQLGLIHLRRGLL